MLVLNKSNSNEIREKYINLRQKLPSISVNQKKYSPIIGAERYNWKEEIKNDIEEPEEFMLCEYSDNDDENRNSSGGRDSNKSDNILTRSSIENNDFLAELTSTATISSSTTDNLTCGG